MRKLDGLVTVVEVLASMPKARAQWRELARSDFPVIESSLRPAGEIAAIYPCAQGCKSGRGREIREWQKPIVAVCRDRRCDKVALTHEEVQGFDCDVGALGSAIASALGGKSTAPEQTPAWRWWKIGTLERGAERASLPLILTTTITTRETLAGVGTLLAHGLAPFALIVPRAEVVDLATSSILKREKCELVVLEDELEVDEAGALVARAPIAPLVMTKPAPCGGVAAPNVFRRDGDHRVIAYAGTTIRVRETKGLTYIGLLLGFPGKHFEPAELHRLAASVETSRVVARGSDLLDEEAMNAFRARLEDLDLAIAEASEEDDDERRLAALREEHRAIARELATATGFRGRRRRQGDDADRLRRAVYMAISRASDGLEDALPALARHLRESIKSGHALAYVPDGEFVWET